jgi:hypothetical protein
MDDNFLYLAVSVDPALQMWAPSVNGSPAILAANVPFNSEMEMRI